MVKKVNYTFIAYLLFFCCISIKADDHLHLISNFSPVRDDCNQINWATWSNFTGSSATGTINNGNGEVVNVTMTSNFNFTSTPEIYNHSKFSTYPAVIPNTTVPKTTWSKGTGGTTTMCFSKTVTNPVLLIASLGSSNGTAAKLNFSRPYVVLFNGGNMVYHDNTSLTGIEGYAIIMFPGDFTCVTINSTTEENYTNITWGVRPHPFPVSIAEAKSCGSTQLTASGGVSYQWNGGDNPNSATNKFHTSGTYIVTITNSVGCTTSVSKEIVINSIIPTISGNTTDCNQVTLTASGGDSYIWDGGLNPTSAINTFTESGTYSVKITDIGGCSSTLSKTITITPILANITGDVIGCEKVILTATGGTSYLWNGGESPTNATNTFSQSGTYAVTVTANNGCKTTVNKTVQIGPQNLSITGNAVGCNYVTLAAFGGISYQWDGGSTPNSAANTFTQSGTYNVKITDLNGCSATLSKTIVIENSTVPAINITVSPTTATCEGTPVNFTATPTNGGSTPTFNWYKNGTYVSSGVNYVASSLKNKDEISCELISSSACSMPVKINSNTIKMEVFELPSVSFTEDYELEKAKTIQLNPLTTGNIQSFSWSPNIGINNPTIKNPLANPSVTTIYKLTVTSVDGCKAEATVKVSILRDIFIPNVFSPNADGKNDGWLIRNIEDYPGTKVDIFNRHGTKVYHSDSYYKPWDGKYNGAPLPVGTYYYMLYLNNKAQTFYQGSVTILK